MPESSRIPVRCPSAPNSRLDRRHVDAVHAAGLRLPALRGILGVEPGLDRMPLSRRWFGVEALAVGDGELQFDQVEPGGLLGHRVLDLQPGVHLQEVELAVLRVGSARNSTVPAPV